MKLFKVLKFIYNHPFNADNKLGSLWRFAKWQINCRLNPYPVVYPFTEHSKFIIRKGLTGATGNIYCGLMEFEDMGFLLHFLRPKDLFVDIGANVGSYTILASAEIFADTIAIEPIPSTYQNLKSNILINDIQDKVKAYNIGLGSNKGKLNFTKSLDTINHVVSNGNANTIEVEVNTLDNILQQVEVPVLIKIDVEGFETEVLHGAENTLANPELKAIIIELNGSGNRYGYNEEEIHQKLLLLDFRPYGYNPKERKLTERKSFNNLNTIYIRNKEFVENRINTSRKIKIGNTQKTI
ncbi:MAG: FkbM family methyltransferase [Ferruginibacter sp.]|nr:FkbM family methyltransferase [Ferruginibacter sp.]